MKSILDRSFQYTPSAATDLSKKFARIKRDRKAAATAGETEYASWTFPEQRESASVLRLKERA